MRIINFRDNVIDIAYTKEALLHTHSFVQGYWIVRRHTHSGWATDYGCMVDAYCSYVL